MSATATSIGAAALAAGLLLAGCSGDHTDEITDDPPPDAAVTGGGAAVAALAQADDGTSSPHARGITVVGTGRVTGQPDTLTTTLGVEVERRSVDGAVTEANDAAQRIIDAIVAAGVAEEDVQTREFSIQPRYDHPRQGPPVLRGYVATNVVEATLRDIDRAGAVLTAATDAGGDAARVRNVRFSLEDNQALLEAARERAFEDARARAEQYAQLAGRDLGRLISLSEHRSAAPPPEPFRGPTAADAAGGRAVPIQPGQEEVRVEVTVVWALS